MQGSSLGAKSRPSGRSCQLQWSAAVFRSLCALLLLLATAKLGLSISIKPADFDRLIMPCYLQGYFSQSASPMSPLSQNPFGTGGQAQARYTQLGNNLNNLNNLNNPSPGASSNTNNNNNINNDMLPSSSSSMAARLAVPATGGPTTGGTNFGAQPAYYASSSADFGQNANQVRGRSTVMDLGASLGQQVPRANTIDNFIALLSKIEAQNPRLANDPDQLIRILLARFRLDDFYYDVRSRTKLADEKRQRANEIISALVNSAGPQQQQYGSPFNSDTFPEHLLDHDEKCSMYFMLSHFIEKVGPPGQPLASTPVNQLTGPLGNQRAPSLQAAGAGYPAQSADAAYRGMGVAGAGNPRFSGPTPSFGSPATSNMNSFAAGLSDRPDYTGKNPYGMNVPQPTNQLNVPQIMRNIDNNQYASASVNLGASNSRLAVPYYDGNARTRDDAQAFELGVVSVANQENAAVVLNRVLLGLLAATSAPQTIRQLAGLIYPSQPIANTYKIDEEIDPLYALTLADLWAFSSIPKAGKPFDGRSMGDNGRWNDTMCPLSFQLDRSSSISFTTAELLGGLDGFNLGSLRRRMLQMRKNIRLSDLLRMYYSRNGFRPQFAEYGVCNRATAINTQIDELRRQTISYRRLYHLNVATSDGEIEASVYRLDSFKEIARQAAQVYAPPELCLDSSMSSDPYPMNPQDQCEIGKSDIVFVFDTSPQADNAFMNMVAMKLAHKIGLSRQTNSLSILTNQQDSTGYGGGGLGLNAILRNSTNTAEVGCALVHDQSRTYQGGQITDPIRLVEMFERALVNLDTEYLVRQTTGLPSSGSSFMERPTSYVSSLFSATNNAFLSGNIGPKNTAGSKVIVWFNYGTPTRASSLASASTNWYSPKNSDSSSQYRFSEAKKLLRENFRGASILGLASNRDDVKDLVYDEQRDIFLDIPSPTSSSSSLADLAAISPPGYLSMDPKTMAALSGPASLVVNKVLQRICDVPSMFQYPMCIRAPSENARSVGFISPGRKQYWMMAPKTFFASRTVRMAFQVEGGRLRVCFGRMSRPDESALKYAQQYGSASGAISMGYASQPASSQTQQSIPSQSISSTSLSQAMNSQQLQQQQQQSSASRLVSSSSNDYYTGLEHGVCKDVSPGLEIDFIVSDPCYKKSIAECEPFYFVINEVSNIGEGDPNYMCRDEGCTRLDQVKFVMTHSGVSCSSAFRMASANFVFIMISALVAAFSLSPDLRQLIPPPSQVRRIVRTEGTASDAIKRSGKQLARVLLVSVSFLNLITQQVNAQQAGVYDFGQRINGEKRGSLTPSEWFAIFALIALILIGLAVSIGCCYYVSRRQSSRGRMSRVPRDEV